MLIMSSLCPLLLFSPKEVIEIKEVAVFGSTVYRIFALKCQKLRTLHASLVPCVIIGLFL